MEGFPLPCWTAMKLPFTVFFYPLHASVLSDCWTRSAFFYILRCTVLVLMCS